MSVQTVDAKDGDLATEQWLQIRKDAGRTIDSETAEVMWVYAQTVDPYGVYPEPPDECWQVGRSYFARSPGSDIWVWFGDLPQETHDRLWKTHQSKLAFPAGLFEALPDDFTGSGRLSRSELLKVIKEYLETMDQTLTGLASIRAYFDHLRLAGAFSDGDE